MFQNRQQSRNKADTTSVVDDNMEFDFQMERFGFRPAMNALGDMPVCVVARDGTIQSFNRAIWEMTALLLAPGMATNARFLLLLFVAKYSLKCMGNGQ